MNSHIIHDLEPITLVGGSCFESGILSESLSYAPGLVAADGGAKAALKLGHMPSAVIGDFDSIDSETKAAIPAERLHHVAEQDSTDFEKCLLRIAAPLILAVGFEGGRLDHTLAVFSTLIRYPATRCIVIGQTDVCFVAPPEIALTLPAPSRLSLFPMAPVCGRSRGLRWPIDGIEFAPGGRIGTSNEVSGPVTLSFEGPAMLVIVPRENLGVVVNSLRRADATWPAREI